MNPLWAKAHRVIHLLDVLGEGLEKVSPVIGLG